MLTNLIAYVCDMVSDGGQISSNDNHVLASL